MALIVGKIEKKEQEGKEIETFNAEFTNGTVSQLRELAAFLSKEGFDIPEQDNEKLAEVIRIGISWLVSRKESSVEKE